MDLSAPGTPLLSRASQAVLKLSRPAKRLIMLGADAVMLPIALWFALVLKFDRLVEPTQVAALLACAVATGLLAFLLFGFYRAVIRFMGMKAIGRMITGVTLSVAGLALCTRIGLTSAVPYSVLTSTGRWRCCTSAEAGSWYGIFTSIARSRARPSELRSMARAKRVRAYPPC